MPSSKPQHHLPQKACIDALISEYVDRKRAGESLTPRSFGAEHPELMEALRPYLDGLSLLEQVCPLGDLGEAERGAVGREQLPAVAGYELLEEVGRGGMGVVYKALQISTKRIVALKVMQAGPFASASARQRFDREVEMAARLQHEAIVRVLESGQTAGQKYYAMDFVRGVPLDRHLAAESDVDATLTVFERICDGVDYAHRQGVIHRDLKPANVLIDAEHAPHILDFGLAKASDATNSDENREEISLPGQVMGTLHYLSPEQAAGTSELVDARTDVYALGVMLFEALTRTLPFDADLRASELIRRIQESPPRRPSALSNRVDGELETILLKALQKDQHNRYQTAHDMAQDIRRYLDGEPILARPPSRLYFLRKKVHKHRLAVGLISVAVVVATIGLVEDFRQRQRGLAQARETALLNMRTLEAGSLMPGLQEAKALYTRYSSLPDAVLVWCQAQYRNQLQDQALLLLERSSPDLPAEWACRALQAEMYRAAGNVERAVALESQLGSNVPDTARAWHLKSLATLDPKRALSCAQQAVERDPSYGLAWCRLTWLHAQAGDLDGALRGADRLIALGRDADEWTLFKGQALARGGRLEEAIREYSRVTATDFSAYIHRAHAYRWLGRHEEAVADYTEAIGPPEQPRGTAWEYYQRATPLWMLGRRQEAVEDYRRVRLMLGRPFYSDARRFLILRELGRPAEAEAVLEAALNDVEDPWLRQIFRCLAGQLSPEDLIADGAERNNREQICEAYYYAAEMCLLAGETARAAAWFESCVATGVRFDIDTLPLTPMNEHALALWRLESLHASLPASDPH